MYQNCMSLVTTLPNDLWAIFSSVPWFRRTFWWRHTMTYSHTVYFNFLCQTSWSHLIRCLNFYSQLQKATYKFLPASFSSPRSLPGIPTTPRWLWTNLTDLIPGVTDLFSEPAFPYRFRGATIQPSQHVMIESPKPEMHGFLPPFPPNKGAGIDIILTWLKKTGQSADRFPVGARNFFFFYTPKLVLVSTQPPIPRVPKIFSPLFGRW